MTNRPRVKGTKWETACIHALKRAGWFHAERRALHGNVDKGDLAGLPGIVAEMKDCKSLTFGPWLKEAHQERDNAGADIGVVWAKRRGYPLPEDGFVVMDGSTFMRLLKEAGY